MLFAILLLVGCTTASAQEPHEASPTIADQVRAAEARAIAAEQRELESRRQGLLLEAKSELENKAYQRLEILLALFALVLTILVIWFGIRTEKAAARAAKGELADRQRELDEIMAAARVAGQSAEDASLAARAAAASAESHATTAADHSAKAAEGAQTIMMTVTSVMQSQKDKDLEAETVRDAAATPRSERTPNEFRALIDEAREAERWSDVIDLSQGMRFIHKGDDYSVTFSLLQEGYALIRSNRIEEGIRLNSELEKFISSENPSVQRNVVGGIFNNAIQKLKINSQNYGIDDFETLISHYSDSQVEAVRERIDAAFLWRAVAFVVKSDVNKVIESLEAWKERIGQFDCSKIRQNVFFERMKDNPEFQAYLQSNNCNYG
jgi:hypothetical protein